MVRGGGPSQTRLHPTLPQHSVCAAVCGPLQGTPQFTLPGCTTVLYASSFDSLKGATLSKLQLGPDTIISIQLNDDQLSPDTWDPVVVPAWERAVGPLGLTYQHTAPACGHGSGLWVCAMGRGGMLFCQ